MTTARHLARALTWLIFALTAPALTAPASAAEAPVAPDFTLKARSGENLKLSELRGKVVLIDFWASSCAPCREDLVLLEALHQARQADGLVVLAVSKDVAPAQADDFLRGIAATYPVLYDTRGTVAGLYQAGALPALFLIDRDGRLRQRATEYYHRQRDELARQVEALLRE
jgi:peroxiredoxin